MEEQILMEDTIDLRELYQAVKRKLWLICLLVAIAVTASGIINYFVIEPVYQAELTFMVNFNQNDDDRITKEDIEYGENLVEKYKPIIKSRKVSSQIKKNLGLKMTQEDISESIEIESISGPVLNVKVNNTNPTIARDIANEVPDIFGKELKRIAKVNGLEVIDDAMDLENISQSIAERDYYQNTNKWGIYIINYMLDKLNKLEKKDVILGAGDKIVEELINNKDLDDSERLKAIEYAVAKLNNILYNISGDEKE